MMLPALETILSEFGRRSSPVSLTHISRDAHRTLRNRRVECRSVSV
jgi:hypothetical protein